MPNLNFQPSDNLNSKFVDGNLPKFRGGAKVGFKSILLYAPFDDVTGGLNYGTFENGDEMTPQECLVRQLKPTMTDQEAEGKAINFVLAQMVGEHNDSLANIVFTMLVLRHLEAIKNLVAPFKKDSKMAPETLAQIRGGAEGVFKISLVGDDIKVLNDLQDLLRAIDQEDREQAKDRAEQLNGLDLIQEVLDNLRHCDRLNTAVRFYGYAVRSIVAMAQAQTVELKDQARTQAVRRLGIVYFAIKPIGELLSDLAKEANSEQVLVGLEMNHGIVLETLLLESMEKLEAHIVGTNNLVEQFDAKIKVITQNPNLLNFLKVQLANYRDSKGHLYQLIQDKGQNELLQMETKLRAINIDHKNKGIELETLQDVIDGARVKAAISSNKIIQTLQDKYLRDDFMIELFKKNDDIVSGRIYGFVSNSESSDNFNISANSNLNSNNTNITSKAQISGLASSDFITPKTSNLKS